MKKVTLSLAFLIMGSVLVYSQSNENLIKHYENFYQQMKTHGDVPGIINALTHLYVLKPTQPTKDTLAYLYANSGKHMQALNTIGIERNINDSDVAVQTKAIALKSINQPKRALEQFELLFERNANPFLAYEIADLQIQTGDNTSATSKIEYGLSNAKDDMKYAFYESQTPYQVPLKAAFLHIKALIQYNNNKNNIDLAVTTIDQALELAPNFNLATLSKQALLARKNQTTE